MDKSMITTTLELPGYKIIKSLGIVRGLTVRTNEFGEHMAGKFKAMAGGKIDVYVELCNQIGDETYDEMVKNAENLGANAVIGFRYEISQGMAVTLAYGTAVIVESDKNTKNF